MTVALRTIPGGGDQPRETTRCAPSSDLPTGAPPSRRLAAGGLLALPLLMAQCDPACEPEPAGTLRRRGWSRSARRTSLQGRPITAYRLGTPGGKVVLVVGSIHGDEQAGIEIAEYVRDAAPIPAGFDVFVIPTINPDGNLVNSEGNAAGVDLNRNWPPDWAPIDCVLVPQNCSGPAALSEPETKTTADFITTIQPRVTIWYHAVGPVVDRAVEHGVANPGVLSAYAGEVGYPVLRCRAGPAAARATPPSSGTTPSPVRRRSSSSSRRRPPGR